MSQPAATIQVSGTQDVQAAIRKFGDEIASAVSRAIETTAFEMREDVQRQIRNGPKTGVVYKRRSVVHRASRAGEPPANDTGRLINSIYYRKLDEFTAAIGSELEYAFILEFGRRADPAGTKRPAWIPAAERAAPRLEKRIRRVVSEARARAEKATR